MFPKFSAKASLKIKYGIFFKTPTLTELVCIIGSGASPPLYGVSVGFGSVDLASSSFGQMLNPAGKENQYKLCQQMEA